MHEGFLDHASFRWLKIASLLIIASIAAYWGYEPLDERNGGTAVGYVLGGLEVVLIIWLAWFGIRKRRYGGKFRLKGWLSAHVYLGLALLVIGFLHAGFQVGWNVHTLALVLMCLVIFSGIFGVFMYAYAPQQMTINREGRTLEDMINDLGEIDRDCRDVATDLSDEINSIVVEGAGKTRIGGGLFAQLSGGDGRCGTKWALERLTAIHEGQSSSAGGPSDKFNELMRLMTRKADIVGKARRDVKMKALMDVWLFFHVPLTFALLASLIAHVISVFYYW